MSAAPGAGRAAGAPMRGGLATANAPPFRLPGEHFAAALGLWGAGALGLVWVAPAVAQGHFPLPRVIAVTPVHAQLVDVDRALPVPAGGSGQPVRSSRWHT